MVLFLLLLSLQPPKEIVVREALVVRPVGRAGRSAIHTDAIEAQIVAGRWKPPIAGDPLVLADGSVRQWERMEADKDGWFSGQALNGGYAYMQVLGANRHVMILEAAGHNVIYVNGEPRDGDP